MEPVVRLREVTKKFGDLVAVDRLSLDVKPGEFLTLLGPSGCGKTTTLRMISGFEVPDAGTVEIGGTPVNDMPPFHRDVNTVFQNYALFPHLNVFENVAYSLSIRRKPREEIKSRVAEMLARVDLADRAASLPSQLSGGQMQRVALARALINQPKLLLLDEPLGALDAKLRRVMQLELKHMQESLGITFIYVTHDQEEALVMSDRVAVMNQGEIQQLAPPAEVFEKPSTLFVAGFVGTVNSYEAVVAPAPGGDPVLRLENGVALEATGLSAFGLNDRVTAVIRPQKVRILPDRDGQAAANTLAASFREAIYQGTVVRLMLDLPNGMTLDAQATPEALPLAYGDLRRGDRLAVQIPPASILVYAR